MTTTTTKSTITLLDASFEAMKQQMDSFLDIGDFQKSFISDSGSNDLNFFYQFGGSAEFVGPTFPLAIQYNSSIVSMIAASDLPQQAQKIKQNYFGQALMSSFSQLATEKTTTDIPVVVTVTGTRLVVVNGFGFGLGAILILLGVTAAGLPFLTNLRKRPLQLEHDPSTAAAAALLLDDTEPASCFEGLDRATDHQMKHDLSISVFRMSRGHLSWGGPHASGEYSHHETPGSFRFWPKANDENRDWRPRRLRVWAVSVFFALLILIIVALLVIYITAKRHGLYESAFVYQSQLEVGKHNIATLAPFSIIPTLVAALIKLWWAFFDGTFRRLTPFLSMVRAPQRPSHGAALSYLTTPLLWVTAVASKKGHWFLALVTFGAFTAEVLQVTMSALWTAEPGVLSRNVVLNQALELRAVSHIFSEGVQTGMGGYHSLHPGVIAALNGDTSRTYNNWMYHALLRAVSNDSAPPFSRDSWGFPPLDLGSVTNQIPIAQHAAKDPSSATLGSAMNVTFNSPAISGRLECSSIDNTDTSIIFITRNLTDSLDYNVTRNPKGYDTGFEISEKYLNFVGLGQDSGETNNSSFYLGNWIKNITYSSNTTNEPQNNFTIVWFNSTAPLAYYGKGTDAPALYWIFPEIPQVNALNCNPIFEKANAKVTVNVADGSIQEYELLDSPEPAPEAWLDNYSKHYSNASNLFAGTDSRWNETVR
jgi:hypothetical protein